MKNILYVLCLATPVLATASSCPLCEVNRAYNKEHPGDFEYYDDYLKAEKKEKVPEEQKKPEVKKN